jgi:hypothetical protein
MEINEARNIVHAFAAAPDRAAAEKCRARLDMPSGKILRHQFSILNQVEKNYLE